MRTAIERETWRQFARLCRSDREGKGRQDHKTISVAGIWRRWSQERGQRGKWLSLEKHQVTEQGAAGPFPEGFAWPGSLLTEMERKWRRFRTEQQTEGQRKA